MLALGPAASGETAWSIAPPPPQALLIVPVILSIISEEIRQTLQCMAVFLVLGELWGSFMHIVTVFCHSASISPRHEGVWEGGGITPMH